VIKEFVDDGGRGQRVPDSSAPALHNFSVVHDGRVQQAPAKSYTNAKMRQSALGQPARGPKGSEPKLLQAARRNAHRRRPPESRWKHTSRMHLGCASARCAEQQEPLSPHLCSSKALPEDACCPKAPSASINTQVAHSSLANEACATPVLHEFGLEAGGAGKDDALAGAQRQPPLLDEQRQQVATRSEVADHVPVPPNRLQGPVVDDVPQEQRRRHRPHPHDGAMQKELGDGGCARASCEDAPARVAHFPNQSADDDGLGAAVESNKRYCKPPWKSTELRLLANAVEADVVK
jgi:hypothetical protein